MTSCVLIIPPTIFVGLADFKAAIEHPQPKTGHKLSFNSENPESDDFRPQRDSASSSGKVCVCACVCACVRACVHPLCFMQACI